MKTSGSAVTVPVAGTWSPTVAMYPSYTISNQGDAGKVIVVTSTGDTTVTLPPGASAVVSSDGTNWRARPQPDHTREAQLWTIILLLGVLVVIQTIRWIVR